MGRGQEYYNQYVLNNAGTPASKELHQPGMVMRMRQGRFQHRQQPSIEEESPSNIPASRCAAHGDSMVETAIQNIKLSPAGVHHGSSGAAGGFFKKNTGTWSRGPSTTPPRGLLLQNNRQEVSSPRFGRPGDAGTPDTASDVGPGEDTPRPANGGHDFSSASKSSSSSPLVVVAEGEQTERETPSSPGESDPDLLLDEEASGARGPLHRSSSYVARAQQLRRGGSSGTTGSRTSIRVVHNSLFVFPSCVLHAWQHKNVSSASQICTRILVLSDRFHVIVMRTVLKDRSRGIRYFDFALQARDTRGTSCALLS